MRYSFRFDLQSKRLPFATTMMAEFSSDMAAILIRWLEFVRGKMAAPVSYGGFDLRWD